MYALGLALLFSSSCGKDSGSDTADDAAFIVLDERGGEYDWADYHITTLALTEGFGLTTPDDQHPRFQVLAPREPGDSPRPVLLFLHGGSSDDDSVTPGGEEGSCGVGYASESVTGQLRNSALAHHAVELGWIVVAPENAFCDGWVGLGEDDPADPSHGGYRLAEIALEWALDDGAADPDRVHVVGSSMGAMGAAFFVNTWPGAVLSAGFAHGSINSTRLYYEEDYNPAPLEDWVGRLSHNLGGAPFEDGPESAQTTWYPRYRDTSLELSVLEGSLAMPLFHLWSDQDPVSIGAAHVDMPDAFEAGHGERGIAWGDYNSGVQAHSVVHNLDFPYATLALVRFLDGLSVTALEGEDGAGPVGTPVWSDDTFALASGTGARVTDRSGLLYRQSVPASAGQELRATFFLIADAATTATLRMTDSDGAVLSEVSIPGDQLDRGVRDYPALREVMARTTLSAAASGDEVWLEVESDGGGSLALDVVLID